jgi:Uri superfamily endonuclease
MTDYQTGGQGTYIILLRLAKTEEITIGQLGRFLFPAGFYAYVGSALGPGGVGARLARHRRPDKPLRWHVDYLRIRAEWINACYAEGHERLECHWARALLSLPGASAPAPHFGASDCHCPAHLIHLPALPLLDMLSQHLGCKALASV